MDSCLLCLELNKELLDSIKANSIKWQELNIKQILEKHFWPLNIIQNSSWICLTCWKEVDDFHKFYLRVEEAHTNFGRVKVEVISPPLEYKEEFPVPKQKLKDFEDGEKDNFGYCFLEPEILIDQSASANVVVERESPLKGPINELDLYENPLKEARKYLRTENDIDSKDPLEKCKKPKISKNKNRKKKAEKESLKRKEDSKVKKESIDSNESIDSDSSSHHDDDKRDVNYQPEKESSENLKIKKAKSYKKHNTNRKENDKFIAEHFKQMFCDLCQVPFKDFPAMQKHFSDTHNQMGYLVCCNRKFFQRNRLVDHLQSHLNPDHFKCLQCGKVLSDRVKLKSHMLFVHQPNEVVLKHSCDICGKSFKQSYLLRTHKLTHLPEEEKKFPCGECGKLYASSYLLKLHTEVVHLKTLAKICYICGKTLSTSTAYKDHLKKHEGIPANLNCDICGLRLTSDRSLKQHKQNQHPIGGKREHCCPLCPKISPTLRALKKHINTMHEKGFEHKCTLCEKAFKRAEALKEHMASHTGTALYTCPWCPKTFNSNGNMHAHRKKMHPKEWEESKLQKYIGIEFVNANQGLNS